MIDYDAVALRLQLLPRILGKKDKDLAAAAGVTKTTWSNWKKGTNRFPPDAALALWEVFEIPMAFMYGGLLIEAANVPRQKLYAMEKHVQAELMKRRRRRSGAR